MAWAEIKEIVGASLTGVSENEKAFDAVERDPSVTVMVILVEPLA